MGNMMPNPASTAQTFSSQMTSQVSEWIFDGTQIFNGPHIFYVHVYKKNMLKYPELSLPAIGDP